MANYFVGCQKERASGLCRIGQSGITNAAQPPLKCLQAEIRNKQTNKIEGFHGSLNFSLLHIVF